MNVESDEAVISSDHGQPRGGHSEVEPKAEHCVRSKGRSVNGGKRKQIGSGRGSPRARARIALSCAALLGRRRRGESLLRHRMSARVMRMPASGVVADVTRNEPIGRERRELFRESNMVAFRKERPGVVGAARTFHQSPNRKPPGSRWCASRGLCGKIAAWFRWRREPHFRSEGTPALCRARGRACIHNLRNSFASRALALHKSLPMIGKRWIRNRSRQRPRIRICSAIPLRRRPHG